MKDKPNHIATHITGAIERLSDENLSGEELTLETNRAKGIASLGSAYVGVRRLYIDAFNAAHNAGLNPTRISDDLPSSTTPGA